MDKPDDDYDENIARWLQEAGRRRRSMSVDDGNQAAEESNDDLIRYLRELTGRKLTSKEDVYRMLSDFRELNAEAARGATRRRMVREVLLIVLLAASYLQYYFWEVNLQIAAMHPVHVFVSSPNDQTPRHVPNRIPTETKI